MRVWWYSHWSVVHEQIQLQQVPARNKNIGPLIRLCFSRKKIIRGVQQTLVSKSQEYLHTIHTLSKYDGASSIAEAYLEGDADFHQEVANLVDIDRKTAKTIGLGIMYGMGKGKLADQLAVTVDEASDILSKFNTYAPFVRVSRFKLCVVQTKKDISKLVRQTLSL